MVNSLPDGTLSIKKTINKDLIELELLEEGVGEPIIDMPYDDSEDDSGSLFDGNLDNIVANSNEIIINLSNSSSIQKRLIIKYID